MGSTSTSGAEASSEDNVYRQTNSRHQFVKWVLVDGDRMFLTIGGSVALFGLFLLLHLFGVVAFTNDDSITRMASGMIAGTFSLVTLVVSVNQLILSEEFTPAGEFRDRRGSVLEFRQDVAAATGVPAAPAEPTRLLELIATDIRQRAGVLADAVDDNDNEEYRDQIVHYAASVTDSAEQIDETLSSAEVNTLDALSAAVEYDDLRQLYAARHFRNEAPALSAETSQAFDELIETLQLFSTAQEQFKTIYLQRELTRFSQLTIYCGVPAVLASVLIALLHGATGGTTITPAYLPYVTSLLATVVFVPLILLGSYILRTATLTRRTAAVGPLLPQKDHSEGSFAVSYGEE